MQRGASIPKQLSAAATSKLRGAREQNGERWLHPRRLSFGQLQLTSFARGAGETQQALDVLLDSSRTPLES